MSNETVSKPRTRRSPAEGTSTAAERPAAEVSETTKKPVVPKEIDPNQIITDSTLPLSVSACFYAHAHRRALELGLFWSRAGYGAERIEKRKELQQEIFHQQLVHV